MSDQVNPYLSPTAKTRLIVGVSSHSFVKFKVLECASRSISDVEICTLLSDG